MGGTAQRINQTVDTGDRTINFSPALTNNETYLAYDTAGNNQSFSSLPSSNGAFITNISVTVGGVKSKNPGLANDPVFDSAAAGNSSVSHNPPIVVTSQTVGFSAIDYGPRYKFKDTFYTLNSVVHGPNTASIVAYLDDPAEGAEGAEMMAMIAGGF